LLATPQRGRGRPRHNVGRASSPVTVIVLLDDKPAVPKCGEKPLEQELVRNLPRAFDGPIPHSHVDLRLVPGVIVVIDTFEVGPVVVRRSPFLIVVENFLGLLLQLPSASPRTAWRPF
jgi:hypothetical protein